MCIRWLFSEWKELKRDSCYYRLTTLTSKNKKKKEPYLPSLPIAVGSTRSARRTPPVSFLLFGALVMLTCITAPVTNKPGKVPCSASRHLLTQLSGGGSGASQTASPPSPRPVHTCPETLGSGLMRDPERRPGTSAICRSAATTKPVRGPDLLSLFDPISLGRPVISFPHHCELLRT